MKVGDLVKYSSGWLEENLYDEEMIMGLAGFGIVLKIEERYAESASLCQEVMCFVHWTKGINKTWEREFNLEIVNESR